MKNSNRLFAVVAGSSFLTLLLFQNCAKVNFQDAPVSQQSIDQGSTAPPLVPLPQDTLEISCGEDFKPVGDMAIDFSAGASGSYNLIFGTIADNYWLSGQQDRSMRFNVNNVNRVSRFKLVNAKFDDWLWVRLNGVTVFLGPQQGRNLVGSIELQSGSVVDQTGAEFPAELGVSWDVNVDVDLRPYLKNGVNEIWMRTIVAGAGEGAISMNIMSSGTCSN